MIRWTSALLVWPVYLRCEMRCQLWEEVVILFVTFMHKWQPDLELHDVKSKYWQGKLKQWKDNF